MAVLVVQGVVVRLCGCWLGLELLRANLSDQTDKILDEGDGVEE